MIDRSVRQLMQILEMPSFTVREAAKLLGVRRETVYWYINHGRVAAKRDVCNQWRIPYQELHRLVKERADKDD
jgi:excisionase family DNA binding protein